MGARVRELFEGFELLIAACGPYEVAPAKTRVAFKRITEPKETSVWGSETPIICLTCGFATRGEDERALFRMPGKQAIGFEGRWPWDEALGACGAVPGRT